MSPESPLIFHLIRELYRARSGDWKSLLEIPPVLQMPSSDAQQNLEEFLRYAATLS